MQQPLYLKQEWKAPYGRLPLLHVDDILHLSPVAYGGYTYKSIISRRSRTLPGGHIAPTMQPYGSLFKTFELFLIMNHST